MGQTCLTTACQALKRRGRRRRRGRRGLKTRPVMLAGLPVPNDAVDELAALVRATGADELADPLDRAVADEVKLLALTLDERAIILGTLEDPPPGLAELRAVLLADHRWRRNEGLD